MLEGENREREGGREGGREGKERRMVKQEVSKWENMIMR